MTNKTVTTLVIIILLTSGLPFIFNFNTEYPTASAINITVNDDGGADYTKIQDAINNATKGDIIYVWAGTYYENVLVNRSVTLIGNGTTNTTINGGGSGDVVAISADWVNITGFTMTNSGQSTWPSYDAGIDIGYISNITIYDNNCSNNGVGINIDNPKADILVENNTCNFNFYSGIQIDYSISNIYKNNNCSNNNNNGLYTRYSYYDTFDLNNFMNNNYGLYLYDSDNNIIINNTFIDNNFGFLVRYADSNQIINNTFFSKFTGFSLENSNYNVIKDNLCLNISDSISLNYCSNTIINNNKLINCSIELWSGGVSHWTTHTIDTKNTVNGKPVYYWKNKTSGKVPAGAGQIILADCSNIIIENQNCSNGRLGFLLGFSNDSIIRNNICMANHYGIYLFQSNRNTINNNILDYNRNYGLTLSHSTENTVRDNSISYGDVIGIQLWYSTYSNITDNIINSNINSGIWGSNSNYNNLINNSCNQNYNGIRLSDSHNNNYINNSCDQNSFAGLSMTGYGTNNLINNSCNQNDMYGIFNQYSTLSLIANNSCKYNNQYGMHLDGVTNSQIEYNDLSYNQRDGFSAQSVRDSTFSNNNISFNSNIGLNLRFSYDNYIFFNNIISNHVQASELAENNWNNTNSEGNYWSDYYGLDNGAGGRDAGDGIGDTDIPHNDLDNYPFILATGWLYPGAPGLLDPGVVDSDGDYTIYWNRSRGATGYILEEDDNYAFTSPAMIYTGPERSCQVFNRKNGTYYYRLSSFNKFYQRDWSNIVDMIVDWLPDIPKNLKVSVYPEGNALNITWDPNQVDIKEYDIYYKDIGSWQFLVSVPHPFHSYNHTGLQDGKEYYYLIRARDHRDQTSEPSVIKSAVPKDSSAPQPPQNLSVTILTHDSLFLSWETNKELDLLGYNIYRSEVSNPTFGVSPVATMPPAISEYIDDNLDEQTTYYYAITSFDEVPNESEYSDIVSATTFIGPREPQINNSISDFEIVEDTIDNTSINLFYWFSDANSDPLIFYCRGQKFIEVTIFQQNGTVILIPSKNWNGEETLSFYASDGSSDITDDVTITATPVNDPPAAPKIIQPLDGIIISEGDEIELEATCDDLDLPYGDVLTFNWSSNISGSIGIGNVLSNFILPMGVHLITLEVSDLENETSSISFTIRVNESAISDKDGDGMPNVWERKYDFNPKDPSDMNGDADEDGVVNIDEYKFHTNPRIKDTDDDGLSDGEEINKYKTNATNPDTDGDGHEDGEDDYPLDFTRWKKEQASDFGVILSVAIGIVILIIVIILIFLLVIKPRRDKKATVLAAPPKLTKPSALPHPSARAPMLPYSPPPTQLPQPNIPPPPPGYPIPPPSTPPAPAPQLPPFPPPQLPPHASEEEK